jgi:hypothetical protein
MAALAALAIGAGTAHAAPVALCMKPGQPVAAPAADGTCASGYTKTETASQADLTAARNRISALEAKLANVTLANNTLRISGVNVRIDNGAGATTARNGLGNLILGYNESPGQQTGSHNFMLGRSHTATGYGGIVAGASNKLTGGYAVAVGYGNTAQGKYSFAAGDRNTASGERASATGGSQNTAAGLASAVTGGMLNRAADRWTAITGGCSNRVDAALAKAPETMACVGDVATDKDYRAAEFGVVHAGTSNLAKAVGSAVTGGGYNTASAPIAVVSGGRDNSAGGLFTNVTGGWGNNASGYASAILGGLDRSLTTDYGTYPAGS